jgi:hypothetical protein
MRGLALTALLCAAAVVSLAHTAAQEVEIQGGWAVSTADIPPVDTYC